MARTERRRSLRWDSKSFTFPSCVPFCCPRRQPFYARVATTFARVKSTLRLCSRPTHWLARPRTRKKRARKTANSSNAWTKCAKSTRWPLKNTTSTALAMWMPPKRLLCSLKKRCAAFFPNYRMVRPQKSKRTSSGQN